MIHEAFLSDEKSGPLPVAEYSALLMNITQGKCYAPSEYGSIFQEPGLTVGPYRDTVADRGFMTAVKRRAPSFPSAIGSGNEVIFPLAGDEGEG